MKSRFSLLSLLVIVPALTACNIMNNGDNSKNKHSSSNTFPEMIFQETEEYKDYPHGDSNTGYDVTVTMNKNSISSFEICPWIYGSSFENLGTTTYNGIYSEIIMDRKFYFNVGDDKSPWEVTKGTVTANVTSPFEGVRSMTLKKGASIKQTNIPLDKDITYAGYVWAKGSGTLVIEYASSSGSNKISAEINIDSRNSYQKYSYEVTSLARSKVYVLSIASTTGDISIDSVSLMPKENYYGMRLDTLAHLKAMKVPFLRWPGGDGVSGYNFYDGIGDKDKRPTKENLAWSYRTSFIKRNFYFTYDPNDFGLEEFLMLCKYLECESNVVVNAGYGTSDMAADEVQFCNGASNSVYGSKRLLSTDPYNVKIWSVGNEMYGEHELGYTDVHTFANRTIEFVTKMKQIDPTIKIIGCGQNFSTWSSTLIAEAGTYMDYISQHFYAPRNENDVKKHILSMCNQQAEVCIRAHRNIPGSADIPLAFDEYGYFEVTTASRLKDGMGVAATLNTYIKNGDAVKIACFSETVNSTQGTVMTSDFDAHTEANGYVLSMYSRLAQKHYLTISYNSSADNFYLMGATINSDKDTITLSVINACEQTLKVKSRAFKNVKSIEFLTGEGYNSYNVSGREMLKKYRANLSGKSVIIQPRCVALVTIGV